MTDHPRDASLPSRLAAYRKQLDCRFPRVGEVFSDCIAKASARLGPAGEKQEELKNLYSKKSKNKSNT